MGDKLHDEAAAAEVSGGGCCTAYPLSAQGHASVTRDANAEVSDALLHLGTNPKPMPEPAQGHGEEAAHRGCPCRAPRWAAVLIPCSHRAPKEMVQPGPVKRVPTVP